MARDNPERLLLIGFCKTSLNYFASLSSFSKEEQNMLSSIDWGGWNKASLQGLRMAANDMIEMGNDLSETQISELDALLESFGFPSFTAMKNKNFRHLLKILGRGVIKSDTEYYLLNSYISDVDNPTLSPDKRSEAEKMLLEYEKSNN